MAKSDFFLLGQAVQHCSGKVPVIRLFSLFFFVDVLPKNLLDVVVSQEGNSAAWKCGMLKAGQILLQVDETPLRGMTSGIAVLTLRHAYSSPDLAVLKLFVRDV